MSQLQGLCTSLKNEKGTFFSAPSAQPGWSRAPGIWHTCVHCLLFLATWGSKKQAQRQGWSGRGLRHSYPVDQKEEPGGSLLSWLDGGRPVPHSQALFCCHIEEEIPARGSSCPPSGSLKVDLGCALLLVSDKLHLTLHVPECQRKSPLHWEDS